MPATPDEIRSGHAKRFAYLKAVYEDWQRVRSGTMQKLDAVVVRDALGLAADEADRIEEYLKGRNLIKYITFGPLIQITQSGIDYVEQALAEPDQATQYFPAVNVLHIEQVINSQIQQGTTDSQQTGHWKGVSPQELLSIISEIRAALSSVTLQEEHREDADANLATLEAQAKSRRPNQTIIREVLTSMRTIAEQVGAALLAGKIGAWLSGAAGTM